MTKMKIRFYLVKKERKRNWVSDHQPFNRESGNLQNIAYRVSKQVQPIITWSGRVKVRVWDKPKKPHQFPHQAQASGTFHPWRSFLTAWFLSACWRKVKLHRKIYGFKNAHIRVDKLSLCHLPLRPAPLKIICFFPCLEFVPRWLNINIGFF